jgi:hypothetical protein
VEAEAKLAKAIVGAYVRASRDRVEAAKVISDQTASKSVRLAVKPPRVASSLKKAGIALILAPDPITGVAGGFMLGASLVMKRREAAGLQELIKETADTMRGLRELQSLL